MTPPPSLATFKQLRALAGRKAQPIGCGDIRGVGHNGPGHDGVLANRGVDGSTCIPKRKRGRVSVPEVTRKSCGGLGTKHVDEGDIVVRSAPMVKLSPKRGRHGDRLHRPPDALDARSGRGGIGACEARIDNLPTHEAADEEHGTLHHFGGAPEGACSAKGCSDDASPGDTSKVTADHPSRVRDELLEQEAK